jgi:hypothetical protein
MSHDQGASAPLFFLVPAQETKIMREVFWEQFTAKEPNTFSHAWREMLKHPETPCRPLEPVGWTMEGPMGRSYTAFKVQAEEWRRVGLTVKEVYA